MDVASGPQVLLDELENTAYGDPGNLQVHITGVYMNSGTATKILSSWRFTLYLGMMRKSEIIFGGARKVSLHF